MNKRNVILVSILLIAAGVVIHFLTDHTDGTVDLELTGFFSGILFGAGLAILVTSIFKKGKNSTS